MCATAGKASQKALLSATMHCAGNINGLLFWDSHQSNWPAGAMVAHQTSTFSYFESCGYLGVVGSSPTLVILLPIRSNFSFVAQEK